jgi:hypothetical protein
VFKADGSVLVHADTRGYGYSMQGTTTGRGKRIYRCTRTHAGGVCPEPVRVDALALEEAALGSFWALVDDLEAQGTTDDRGTLAALHQALDRAEQRLAEYLSPAVQDEVGDTMLWATGLGERRRARDDAAKALGAAKAEADERDALPSARSLRADWDSKPTRDRRELLGAWFDLIAVGRDGSVVVFPRGTGPADLPTRGYRRDPQLYPITDIPADGRTLAA